MKWTDMELHYRNEIHGYTFSMYMRNPQNVINISDYEIINLYWMDVFKSCEMHKQDTGMEIIF